jgi:hypothetical protein
MVSIKAIGVLNLAAAEPQAGQRIDDEVSACARTSSVRSNAARRLVLWRASTPGEE